ncbi:MAG: primosomal protein N', partial [Gemmatimonadota bacterium]
EAEGDGGDSGAAAGGGEAESRTVKRNPPPDGGPTVFSARLLDALEGRLERGEQSILLLNRRGYSNFVQCPGCGKVWECERCAVSLTYHRGRDRMACHHCAFEAPAPEVCDECGEPEPRFVGAGTEQVERRLGE